MILYALFGFTIVPKRRSYWNNFVFLTQEESHLLLKYVEILPPSE